MKNQRFLPTLILGTSLMCGASAQSHSGPPHLTHKISSKSLSPNVLKALGAVEDRMQGQSDAWFNDGKFLSSIQTLRMLNALEPTDYGLVTDLGWMMENVHENDLALGVYEQYQKLLPNQPEASFPLGFYYFRFKNYKEACKTLEPSLHMKIPASPNTYRILARSYEKSKQLQDSLRVYKSYIKIAPSDLQAIKNAERVQAEIDKSKK